MTDTDAKDKAAAEQASNIYNASRLNEPVDRFELEHFRQGFLAGCAHVRKEQAQSYIFIPREEIFKAARMLTTPENPGYWATNNYQKEIK